MIPVTKPFLPPKEDFLRLIDGIWNRNWLTNNGPLVNDLELRLKEYLNVEHLLFLSNGTLALQIAIRALNIKGKVITTPFSYVATTTSIVWENAIPVFVDINPDNFNLDPNLIEAAIDKDTQAILATHVFGNPCDIEAIERIALKYNLKVIYDAAHCFGTQYKNKSVFEYGDISTASFHATKVFHTVEGGAVFSNSAELIRKMALLRNFGHLGPSEFDGFGTNAKNSEFHAAMGLANLVNMNEILNKRKTQWLLYEKLLQSLNVKLLKISPNTIYNYSYFPIVFESETQLLKSIEELNKYNIFPRRYFYPSLNTLDYVPNAKCPISEQISKCVLCLPLYYDLSFVEQEMIFRILKRTQKYQV